MPTIAATDYSGAIGGFSSSPKSVYTPGIFNDINENLWYGANNQAVIKSAYELQIMDGKGGGVFDPGGNVTYAEAIKMAAVVHNIYNGGTGKFVQGNPWYQVYVDYAVESGIISSAEFDNDYNRPATRGAMAGIFARCVPESMLQEINVVSYLPDVSENSSYGAEVFKLYRAGVLTGNDSIGTFNYSSYITRAEASAIICRVVIPSERKTLDNLAYDVSIDYYTDELISKYASFHEYTQDESFGRVLLISANTTIKDFRFLDVQVEFHEEGFEYTWSVLYSLDELTPEKPLVVTGPLGAGLLNFRGISYVDKTNTTRFLYIDVSGEDGSLRIGVFRDKEIIPIAP